MSRLNIPFAIQYGKMKERGSYQGGQGPRGAVVHFTCGRYEKGLQNAKNDIDGGIKNGYTFLCIARTGEIVQAHDVMKWGNHAGESAWQVKLARVKWSIVGAVSDDLIGIEMNNAGKLTETKDGRLMTDFKTYIDRDDARFISKEMAKAWGCPAGWYHAYSAAQEKTLVDTILWLYDNVPAFKLEYVVGHHECAGVLGLGYFRKNDPGGSLSMPMVDFRRHLIREWEKRSGKKYAGA